MDHGPYSVTQIASFIGMECPGYSAVLCRNGRPIAAAVDPGNGSNVQLTYFYEAGPDLLANFLSRLPPEPFQRLPEGIAVDTDFFVCALVDEQMQLGQCPPTFGAGYRDAA